MYTQTIESASEPEQIGPNTLLTTVLQAGTMPGLLQVLGSVTVQLPHGIASAVPTDHT